MTHAHEPIACSLPTPDAAGQVDEWADLRRDALTRERLERGVAMTFGIDAADRVEDLAAREAACCGFLSIATTRTAETVRLEITSDDPDAAPVIEALAGAAGTDGQ
ncbi:MAG TPA: hypothetical protein VFF40_11140 [Acidimicrobiia bacterium]|nr:hypothetical protein [Acidimicrobiia bacterium]